ncbi:TetR family transcriptional regulator [Rhodococcus spelaei]|uniref:TetR family transcriptional regulator n=1 Tax=Rhodococcus spelaei TaxID=2546320 RepID=A0A541BS01_9NOCA|nr:TetR family transcriptional regulator [Rhodococcus spelaei]TQF75101.1 TetR family transcriptional regulator [Rhodococcus spelaei]
MASVEGTRSVIIEVAERMFAEHGVEGVSMRDVAAAAGQRNNSAVQYHFGGRDGLLLAVFRYRMGEINQARSEYLAEIDRQGRGEDLRALVEAGLRPLTDFLASVPEGHYARFIARVSPSVDFASGEFDEVFDGNREVVARLTRILGHLSRRAAIERVDLMFNMTVSALAVYEQRREEGLPVVRASFAETVEHVIDMAVGSLEAADSTAAAKRVKRRTATH